MLRGECRARTIARLVGSSRVGSALIYQFRPRTRCESVVLILLKPTGYLDTPNIYPASPGAAFSESPFDVRAHPYYWPSELEGRVPRWIELMVIAVEGSLSEEVEVFQRRKAPRDARASRHSPVPANASRRKALRWRSATLLPGCPLTSAVAAPGSALAQTHPVSSPGSARPAVRARRGTIRPPTDVRPVRAHRHASRLRTQDLLVGLRVGDVLDHQALRTDPQWRTPPRMPRSKMRTSTLCRSLRP